MRVGAVLRPAPPEGNPRRDRPDEHRGNHHHPRSATFANYEQDFGLSPHIRVIPGDYTDIAGVKAALRLLDSGKLPTAVSAANDFVAAGLIDRLEEAGLRFPADLSVIGCDNTYLAALHDMSLTNHQPAGPDMGRRAMEVLVERMEQGRTTPLHIRMTPSLVERDSTRPVRVA